MNYNKAKCETLKKLRKEMADELGIDLHQEECTFEGECTGSCPRCEYEEAILNEAIKNKDKKVSNINIDMDKSTVLGGLHQGSELDYRPVIELRTPGLIRYDENFGTNTSNIKVPLESAYMFRELTKAEYKKLSKEEKRLYKKKLKEHRKNN